MATLNKLIDLDLLDDELLLDVDEFLAEAFTQAKLYSEPSKYAIKVLEIIDKYFKK